MAKNSFNKTKLIALSGIIAAASVMVMLAAYFPWFTYAMPAISGCFLILIVFEANKKYAFLVYCAVSLLSLILCEKESALSYIAFFGYYPIVKALIEKIPSRAAEWAVKFLIFNAAFASIILLGTYVFGLDVDSLGDFGKYTFLITMACGNVMFAVYDIALSRLVMLYADKYHAKLNKYLR